MPGFEMPRGKVIKTLPGGGDALKNALLDLNKYSFTGYLSVTVQEGESERRGYIVTLDGKPHMAMYEVSEGGAVTVAAHSAEAFQLAHRDSRLEGATLRIHAGIDVGELEKQHPLARIKRDELEARQAEVLAPPAPAKAKPKKDPPRRIGLAWGAKGEQLRKEQRSKEKLEALLDSWRQEGYNVESIEDLPFDDLEAANKMIDEFEEKVATLRSLEQQFNALPGGKREKGGKVYLMLKDPSKIGVIASEIHHLEGLPSEEEVRALEEELGERKVAKERQAREGAVYDLLTRHDKVREEEQAKTYRGTPTIDAMLNRDYLFSNFVVGESNQFAFAAAKAVAMKPAKAYNPLFLWSGPGLGKTHLLSAIANHVVDTTDKKVIYITTEKFTNDLIDALQKNEILTFRNHYRSVDVLIVDDIQFLADTERTQEEFFHTFNALFTVEKQIVLASDRPPKEIPTLESRLVSRFEGGLIIDIKPPGFETRIAILHKKAEENGWEVPEEVFQYIAREMATNIRELTGALNKVVAFSKLMQKEINLDQAREALRDLVPESEVPILEMEDIVVQPGHVEEPTVVVAVEPPEHMEASAPVQTEPLPQETEMDEEAEASAELPRQPVTLRDLNTGSSYLVKEEKTGYSFEYFTKYANEGYSGLCISRANPRKIETSYTPPNSVLLWLTDKDSRKVKTISYALEKLIYTMEGFLHRNERSVLLLDGLSYLISNNSFDAVVTFLRRLVDEVSELDSILIVSVSPDTLDEKQLKILEREMEPIDYTAQE